jgi:radical SAM-linked protein
MQRIIKRSGIPVKYTEGYNPHYGISFPMALPFGVKSDYEIMDFKIENGLDFAEISAKLTSAMPQGLSVKSVSNPKYDIREIFAAKYVITVATNNADKFKEFLLQEKIVISKKAKEKNRKIIKEIDIKNIIKCDLITENCINLQLPAAVTGGVNPISVMEIFEKFVGEKVEYNVNKSALILENGELFL